MATHSTNESATTDRAERLDSELLQSVVVTTLSVVIGMAAERWLGFDQIALILLTGVLFISARTRMSVAVVSALLSFLAYGFFFFHPRYSFHIEARQGIATVTIFLLAALSCGQLANRLRSQVLLLRTANAEADTLRQLGRRLTAANNAREAVQAASQALQQTLDVEVVVLLHENGTLQEVDDHTLSRFDPALRAAAQQCLQGSIGSQDSDLSNATATSWYCLPLALREKTLGVVALRFPMPLPAIDHGPAQLAATIVLDTAEALDRIHLSRQLESAHLQAETERLRAALLASVSHDLRSPLSTIIGSAESLCAYHAQLSSSDRQALAEDILGEGRRLDRYIQNLLDMTRLGQGKIVPDREWLALDELFGAVLARLRRDFPAANIHPRLPQPAPLLQANPALLEQALFNVLDNAVKFSPPASIIELGARIAMSEVLITVTDHGCGIAPAERDKVFELFYRVDGGEHGDRSAGGSGLGLAIVRGILAAHGGRVEITAGETGRGTHVTLILPWQEPMLDRALED